MRLSFGIAMACLAVSLSAQVTVRAGGSSYLGVGVADITAERAKALNLKEERGAEVTNVAQDSPAAIAAGAPAHKLAGRAGLPIFEALVNLDQVVEQRFYFVGLPLKLDGVEASPIRAVALVPNVNSSTTSHQKG